MRQWRTRADPLAAVWESELEPLLRQEPRLEATTLYEYLVEQQPGAYKRTLRTVQRQVQEWKALHGELQEVMFELRHEPGRVGHSDTISVLRRHKLRTVLGHFWQKDKISPSLLLFVAF